MRLAACLEPASDVFDRVAGVSGTLEESKSSFPSLSLIHERTFESR